MSTGHTHPRRLAYLDGWRGLSIIAVLAGHFAGAPTGRLGVEMFFALSGRLMSEILFVEAFPLAEFYWRRVSRVFPALLAFIVLAAIALRGTHLRFGTRPAAEAAALVYNYVGARGHRSIGLDHIWSLCVEEHAYLLLGVVALVARRLRLQVLPALLLISAASMLDGVLSVVALHQDWYAAYWRSDAHVASITLSAAAFLILRGRRLPEWLWWAALTGGVALFAAPVSPALQCTAGTALFTLAVNSLDGASAAAKRGLRARALTFAGVVSFSVYLWQQPFYAWAYDHGPLRHALALTAAIAAGLASFYLVETPARRWLNSLSWPKPQHQAADSTGTASSAP